MLPRLKAHRRLKNLNLPPVAESVPAKEESMEDVIMSMIADGQKRTDIAAAFGITHQKVTSIVRQAGK